MPIRYIKPLDRSYTMYHDGTATLGPFAGSFSNFESYLKRLLPHMQHAIEDENGFSDCTSMLKATNIAVVGALQDIVTEVCSMNVHVAVIGQQDKTTFANTQASIFAAVGGVTSILAAFTALASHFSTKFSQEQQLSRSTEQSKSTDSMISQALQAIVTTMEELVKILDNNKAALTAGKYFLYPPPALESAPERTLTECHAALHNWGFCGNPPSRLLSLSLALSRSRARSLFRTGSKQATSQV